MNPPALGQPEAHHFRILMGGDLTGFLRRLAKHTALAMVGGVIGAMLLGILFVIILQVVGLEGTVRRLGSQWYGPDVWLPGLAIGFFVNRRRLHRAACFVWVLGLLWVAFLSLGTATGWRPTGMSAMTDIKVQLFPTTYRDFDACADSECLGLVVGTWPLLNTITYSIGAWLGLMSQPDKPAAEDHSMDFTTLRLS